MIETQHKAWNRVAAEVTFTLEPDYPTLAKLIPKQAKVLDYGCGYGRITNELQRSGYTSITGVDTSQEMINRGLQQFPSLDLRYINSYQLPTELGKFDLIIFCALLTCVPNPAHRAKIIAVAYAALNVGGILYCADFHRLQTIDYAASGTFISKLGVEMKHFFPEEISAEIIAFNEIQQTVAKAITINGTRTLAIHHFAKKL